MLGRPGPAWPACQLRLLGHVRLHTSGAEKQASEWGRRVEEEGGGGSKSSIFKLSQAVIKISDPGILDG